jgi:hypothetical protein
VRKPDDERLAESVGHAQSPAYYDETRGRIFPLAHKDAPYVRSHYDGVSVTLPSDAPAADEVALIACLATRGRLNARVGELAADTTGTDGLR